MMAGAVGRPLTYDHTAWLLRHGLVTRAALGRYEAYALPDLIAYAYPQAEGEARRLLVDILGWFTVLDDHFDGHAGRDLSGTRDLVRRLLDVLQEPAGDVPREPGGDLLRESGGQHGGERWREREPRPDHDPEPRRGPGGDLAGHGRPPAAPAPLGGRHVLGSRALGTPPTTNSSSSPSSPSSPLSSSTSSSSPGHPSPAPYGTGPAQLLAAWRDLWRRQRTGMPPAWSRRAARDWARCLTTFVTEAGHRTAATLPTIGQAVHLRRHASCLYPFMNMLERVRGIALPEAVHAERELRLLRAHVADTATLVNDLYSLEREERHACPFNMIVILRREQRTSRAVAVEAVRAEVERLSIRSDILRNYLAAQHPEADWYLRQTHRLVEGVKLWSSTTDRYTDTSL